MASDPMILGLVGIAATAVTAILAPWLTSRFAAARQRAQHMHDRELNDVDELRRLLDLGAETFLAVRHTVARPSGPGWVEEAQEKLTILDERCRVRLSRVGDDVKHAVSNARDAMDDIAALYEGVEPFRSEEEEEEFWEQMNALREEVHYQEAHFSAAASATVGAHIATRDESPSHAQGRSARRPGPIARMSSSYLRR